VNFSTPAIVCAVLPHGEHGVVARLLTPKHGLRAGYVRGGRGRGLRPVLQLGNAVAAEYRSRVTEQLAALTVELAQSRALLAMEADSAAATEWVCGLVAAALPEAQPFPAVYTALDALLDAMAGPDGAAWAGALARFELGLLGELGFGLDLSRCAATGEGAATADLTHVSPRSGGAVSRIAAAPYSTRLLKLPPFLLGQGRADWGQAADALRLTRHFLDRDVLEGRARGLFAARDRLSALVERRASQMRNPS